MGDATTSPSAVENGHTGPSTAICRLDSFDRRGGHRFRGILGAGDAADCSGFNEHGAGSRIACIWVFAGDRQLLAAGPAAEKNAAP